MFEKISIIKDNCSKSWSVMTSMKVGEYLHLVENIQQLDAQRDVLKTRAAITIRKRLIEDITKGTVIPPVVLGIVMPEDAPEITEPTFSDIFNNAIGSLTIIDGIQRTESLKKATLQDENVSDNNMRVEIWVSKRVSSLIYRMLVLNTGQVPWNTRRQVEVVYAPLKLEAEQRVNGLRLISIGENERRSLAGEFPANVIADLYIAFTSRKVLFDNKESLADDFTRLDVINMTSKQEVSDFFFDALLMLVRLDQQFFRYNPQENDRNGKIYIGRDIFTSAPSRIAFVVAIAVYVCGRAGGAERTIPQQVSKMNSLKQHFNVFIEKLNAMDEDGLKEFLCLGILNDILKALPAKRIGDEERKYFQDAYSLLVKEGFDLDSMEEAWRV